MGNQNTNTTLIRNTIQEQMSLIIAKNMFKKFKKEFPKFKKITFEEYKQNQEYWWNEAEKEKINAKIKDFPVFKNLEKLSK